MSALNALNNACLSNGTITVVFQWMSRFLKKRIEEIDDAHGEQIQRHLQQIKRSQNKIQETQQQEPRIMIVKETKVCIFILSGHHRYESNNDVLIVCM